MDILALILYLNGKLTRYSFLGQLNLFLKKRKKKGQLNQVTSQIIGANVRSKFNKIKNI